MAASIGRRGSEIDRKDAARPWIQVSIIAGILLIGLILAGLAITIVLSLIPTFTSNRKINSIQYRNRGRFSIFRPMHGALYAFGSI